MPIVRTFSLIDSFTTALFCYGSWFGSVLPGCIAVTLVFTCDGECSHNGQTMPHSFMWAMGCPLWGLSWQLLVLQQYNVVMRLNLAWCYQAALQWLGCLPVECVVIMDTPCLTLICELWGAHCGYFSKIESLTTAPCCYRYWSCLMLSGCAALIQVLTCDGVYSYNGHPHASLL